MLLEYYSQPARPRLVIMGALWRVLRLLVTSEIRGIRKIDRIFQIFCLLARRMIR